MRGANMSVVGHVVVECFSTRTTSVRVLGDAFVLAFQMFVQILHSLKPFVAAGTLVRFFPGVDSLVSD